MKFNVPQFIDTEDKIFILLTFKQALYIGGGLGFAVIIWRLPIMTVFKLILATVPVALGVSLAFVKYNMRPFIFFFEAVIKYLFAKKKYVWRKKKNKIIFEQKIIKKVIKKKEKKNLKKSRIDEISRNLDLLNK